MKKRILSILLSLIMAVGMLPTMAMAQETAPTFNLETDLEGITIPENLVTCICTTTDESKPYGQLPGGFTTDGKVIKENGKWTVIVQINKSTYMEKFNTDTGTTHSPSQDPKYSSDFTTPIQFKMKYEGNKWVLDGAMPEDKKLHFTCNGQHAMQEPPAFDLAKDLEGITIPENLVTCICTTTDESKPYGQLPGGFTTDGKVIKENGKWTVIVQINKSTYMEKFNTDTGTTHSPSQDPKYSSDFTTPIQFKMKYEGNKWVLDGAMPEDKKLHFTCNGQHAMQEPPAFDLAKDLEGITIPENLVTCICTTTDESKPYGQLPGGFTTDGKVIKENGKWTVIVQINKKTYMEKFNTDTGTTHSPSQDPKYSSDFTTPIQFKMKYEGGKWVLDGAMPEDKKLHFTCNNDHENQTPNLPMYPTIDNISGLDKMEVGVICMNAPAKTKFYGLLSGGFTSTKPKLNDGMYESTLTLIPSVYCKQYSADTGIPHTVNPNQTIDKLKITVKYDAEAMMWIPKEEVKPMGIWVNCDKHETSTSVTPVYPPSGGGSTIYPGGTPGGNGTIVNPDNNQGDQQPTVDSKDKQGNNKTEKIKKSDTMEKVPKTGDNTAMTIWLVLLLFSVGALFGTVAFDRKRKRI